MLLTLLACASDVPDTPVPTDTADTGPVDTGQDTQVYPDLDEDGFGQDIDCDDDDGNTYPGADEVCGDGVVNDCDGSEDDARATCEHMLTEYGATASWLEGGVDANLARLAPLGDVNGDGFDDVGIGAVHTGYYDDDGNFIYDSGLLDIILVPMLRSL